MRSATVLLSLVVAVTGAARGQEPAGPLADQVDAIFAEWDNSASPGCALGVIKDGEFAYRRGYGMASLELEAPISPSTVFYIGSTSKQFVSASILLAEEAGHLSVDDDIRKYVQIPDYGKTITIRHLLHHTSGLRDYLELWSLAGEKIVDIHEADEALEMIARQKALNFEPGAEYLYSNSGYFMLSVILERATGKSLREFAHENIFEPLGMENTHFHDDHTHVIEGRAIGHLRRQDGSIALNMSNFAQVGSGGLYTSVDDLLLWDRNYYDNKLGDGGLIDRMLVRGVLNNGDTLSYAAALQIGTYKGLRTVAHGGALGGYRAELLRFPDQRFSIVCLCNLAPMNPSGLARQVADIYLADQFEVEPEAPVAEEPAAPAAAVEFVALTQSQLRSLSGAYRDRSDRDIVELSVEGDQLKVQAPGAVFHMSPLSDSHFLVVDAPVKIEVRFESQGPGRRSLMHVDVEGQAPSTFEPIELFKPTGAQLAEYAGRYYSDELEADWELVAEDDALYLEDEPDDPLVPTVKDEFTIDSVTITFLRDEAGRVTGMTLDAGRVRGIRFLRR
ncbi:MAG: serine hydrolase [Gemmatimonadetes bacterium]|nr:serine hydrolase [Gemmatimonadota bacterium]NIO30275.1 serine hydrolase [Gemmatimonadota bacterium]